MPRHPIFELPLLIGIVLFMLLPGMAQETKPKPTLDAPDSLTFHMPTKEGTLSIKTYIVPGDQHVMVVPVVEDGEIVGATMGTKENRYTVLAAGNKLTFSLPLGQLTAYDRFVIADDAGRPMFEAITNSPDPFAEPQPVASTPTSLPQLTKPDEAEQPEPADDRIQKILAPKEDGK